MRVGWDARILVNGQLRGMASYATHLLTALSQHHPNLDLRLYVDEGTRTLELPGFIAKRIGPEFGYRWQLWERLGLPLHAYKDHCDILHSPANTTPPRCPITRVVTLHDAMPFLEWAGSATRARYFRTIQRRAIARADVVITDSEYSRQDICEVLGVAPSRVVTIPLAGSPEIRRPSEATVEMHLQALGVSAPFILALGATDKRKNTVGTLRAFARLPQVDRETSLVLTGITPALKETLLAEMNRFHVSPQRVQMLGFVDLDELSALYAACEAFMFLSMYEGFGIPILDAMQCGAPVVCSNRTSCPEVAGDAAVLVDPENELEVVAAVTTVLERSQEQKAISRRLGETHAAKFSWRRTADLTAAVYRNS